MKTTFSENARKIAKHIGWDTSLIILYDAIMLTCIKTSQVFRVNPEHPSIQTKNNFPQLIYCGYSQQLNLLGTFLFNVNLIYFVKYVILTYPF